ncbi:phage antirepressor N-terminal domain-containing protein [Ectopseudomonas toyotomiensis]|uniref:Phage antirepressor N-terminal domain-containing protein n=1 Tax=Ectopseudomonas toyotomiensis TaxID=554344 RepID=A0AA42LJQ2_9GAMM|nr:phage antirepressor N-terminal domain-containing protein [Pseudomonas toyotomiensis]MBG0839025.1 phage antirepressor N-terminal domain-containing protein [Pseudomonas toyotomiensis]MDH0699900.1 phage antirepressor N-terminal domain-containing protein [Pseudomonas toyotomiensis]
MTSVNTIATVDFHGQTLIVITDGDQHLVAMKPICENIGLSWAGQLERIKRDEVLATCVRVIRMQLPGDTQARDNAFLPLDMLNGWLFGIDVTRCRKEIQPVLIQYKRECYAVLAAHWQKREQPQPQVPSLINRRWLIGYDLDGRENVTPVPDDAMVMNRKQMLEYVVDPHSLGVTNEEIYQLAMNALANLKRRLDHQAWMATPAGQRSLFPGMRA